MIARSFLALPFLLPALVGCGNAAIDDKIAALPDDRVTPSAYHRAGQPCVLCHGVYKGASPELVIGGSVFVRIPSDPNEKPIPVAGAQIIIEDASGRKNSAKDPAKPPEITTNCAGNFQLTHDVVYQYSLLDTLAFPLTVTVLCPDGMGGTTKAPMPGRIDRDGSCAGCHAGKKSETSAGLIVCAGSPAIAPTPQSCPPLFQ